MASEPACTPRPFHVLNLRVVEGRGETSRPRLRGRRGSTGRGRGWSTLLPPRRAGADAVHGCPCTGVRICRLAVRMPPDAKPRARSEWSTIEIGSPEPLPGRSAPHRGVGRSQAGRVRRSPTLPTRDPRTEAQPASWSQTGLAHHLANVRRGDRRAAASQGMAGDLMGEA